MILMVKRWRCYDMNMILPARLSSPEVKWRIKRSLVTVTDPLSQVSQIITSFKFVLRVAQSSSRSALRKPLQVWCHKWWPTRATINLRRAVLHHVPSSPLHFLRQILSHPKSQWFAPLCTPPTTIKKLPPPMAPHPWLHPEEAPRSVKQPGSMLLFARILPQNL